MWELTAKQSLQMQCLKKYGIKEGKPRGNPNYYMSFDPGEGTGWALFSENGYPTDWGNVYGDVKGVFDLLFSGGDKMPVSLKLGPPPEVIIYEKWKLLKTKEFYGSTMLSCQVVGLIRGYAHGLDAEVYSHETSINSTAQKWSGIKPEGSHSTQHWALAFNHGWYHLQQSNKVKPRVLWPEPGVI